jgi:hypothetical protein
MYAGVQAMRSFAASLVLALLNWGVVGLTILSSNGRLGNTADNYSIAGIAFIYALFLLTILFGLNDLRKVPTRIQGSIALALAAPLGYFLAHLWR